MTYTMCESNETPTGETKMSNPTKALQTVLETRRDANESYNVEIFPEYGHAQLFTKEENGKYYIRAFEGKKSKPSLNYVFDNEDLSKEYVKRWLNDLKRNSEWKAKRNAPHTVSIGDVFHNSWGWEQTNIDFFQVVKTTKTTVTVRKIEKSTESYDGRTMSGRVLPLPGNFISEDTETHKTGSDNTFFPKYGVSSLTEWTEVDGIKVYKSKGFTDYA